MIEHDGVWMRIYIYVCTLTVFSKQVYLDFIGFSGLFHFLGVQESLIFIFIIFNN